MSRKNEPQFRVGVSDDAFSGHLHRLMNVNYVFGTRYGPNDFPLSLEEDEDDSEHKE